MVRELADLSDELRERFREIAVPEPLGVATGLQRLHDERRLEVPSTVICCENTVAEVREFIEAGHPYIAELARLRTCELVDLPTGHWPQFTKPAELAQAILAAVSGAAPRSSWQ
jgi:pimeloyl-ACP methyl ester carboxylesterase